MKTVIVALDFSKSTQSVLKEARRFARQADCRLLLVNVVRIPYIYPECSEIMPDIAGVIDAGKRGAKKHLLRLCASLKRDGLEASANVCVGNPADELLRIAGSTRAAYLILALHGHSTVRHLVMGSTASAVLRLAPCPVVVVGEAGRGAQKRSANDAG